MSLSVSPRMARVRPSPTGAVLALVTELRSQGRDIISLGTGEPDFDTPKHIRDAAVAAISRITSYNVCYTKLLRLRLTLWNNKQTDCLGNIAMKIGKYNLHLHSISVHFTNGLYPVAVFFLVLYEIFQQDSFRLTYYNLRVMTRTEEIS